MVGEIDDGKNEKKKKKKTYEWIDRSPGDCLNKLVIFTGTFG